LPDLACAAVALVVLSVEIVWAGMVIEVRRAPVGCVRAGPG
jgi:hypothetical protein